MLKTKKDLQSRVYLIDEVRGFSIVMMVVYHFFYDLVVLFGVNIQLFYSPFIQTLVAIFGAIFVFISGSACLFSRNNLKRGAICFGLGLGVTIGTLLFVPSAAAFFGILHMLGINMMLFALLAPLVKKINPYIGLTACLLLFFFTYSVQLGYLTFFDIFRLELPTVLYSTPFLFWLGLPNSTFFSSDYFPLLPWFFAFFAGSFFGVLVKEKRLPEFFYRSHMRPLAFVGRHTLVIYVLHQPVIYAVLWLVFTFILKN